MSNCIGAGCPDISHTLSTNDTEVPLQNTATRKSANTEKRRKLTRNQLKAKRRKKIPGY